MKQQGIENPYIQPYSGHERAQYLDIYSIDEAQKEYDKISNLNKSGHFCSFRYTGPITTASILTWGHVNLYGHTISAIYLLQMKLRLLMKMPGSMIGIS